MYLEVAIESPRKRGLLVALDSLPHILVTEGKKKAVYRSTYLYYDDAIDYQKANGTLRDFQGMRGLDQIIIDIDKKDNSDKYTQEKAQSIIFDLYELGVTDGNIQPYFSGTGYHIAISNNLFNIEPSKNTPYILRETMRKIFDNIDISIYNRTGIYRMEHTLNSKRGYYKIPLSIRELLNLSPEQIKNLAERQRFEFNYKDISDVDDREKLKGYVVRNVPQVRELQTTFEPKNVVTCLQMIYREGPREGTRNHAVLRFASHYLRHGIPSEAAKAAILNWNNDSLDEQGVLQKIEDTYNRGYRYGCNDFLLKEYCNPRCVYYKNKDYLVEIKNSDDMQKALEERVSANFDGRVICLDELFGLQGKDITIYPGELVTIFGPTGTNKTTLAQNIALGYDAYNDLIRSELQIPTLYLSLELTDWYSHKRHLQIVSGMSKKEIEENLKEMYQFHRENISHIAINTVSPTIKKIREMVQNVQPRCVIVDYIDLVEPPGHIRGEYESIRYISHALSNLAINMDIIIIQLSQTSREYSRKEVLDLYAGKGSGAIENASRKVIGISGNAQRKDRKVEMFKNTDGELFEIDLTWTPSFRLIRQDRVNLGESITTNRTILTLEQKDDNKTTSVIQQNDI
jgi:sugar-specific transcriptional regulator TrmB|tara:strand:- start:1405 stop:3288 length:1884 start_codon:yes stop_codon:yes gene_type:complete